MNKYVFMTASALVTMLTSYSHPGGRQLIWPGWATHCLLIKVGKAFEEVRQGPR